MRAEVPGFVGNIEGKELFAGEVDVAVTDGFTGNILLKSTEAVARLILETLKEELMRSTRTKIGAALAKPAFKSVKQMLDPSEIGAAPLLGIDRSVCLSGTAVQMPKLWSARVKQAKIRRVESGLLDSLRESSH
jgi:glycerol-3-phosphate acyltransferase PlsX